jgi:hypothetical protein
MGEHIPHVVSIDSIGGEGWEGVIAFEDENSSSLFTSP